MEELVSQDLLLDEADKIARDYNELLRKVINISGSEALDMTVRGDFYDTEFEGSLIHSKLQRIAAMLDWKNNSIKRNLPCIKLTNLGNGMYSLEDVYSQVKGGYFSESPLNSGILKKYR